MTLIAIQQPEKLVDVSVLRKDLAKALHNFGLDPVKLRPAVVDIFKVVLKTGHAEAERRLLKDNRGIL